MRAGRLRHRLIVERPNITRDGTGAELVGWATVDIVWASIEPLTGREQVSNGQINAELDTRIFIRWSPAMDEMDATWRLRTEVGSTIYNIAAPPAHVELRKREIQILARSGVNKG